MKKYIKYVFWLALAVGSIYFGLTMHGKVNQNQWPDFSQVEQSSEELAPKVVASPERDFGWRVGDKVPLTFFIQQMPGTRIDVHSMAVEGDFEIVELPKFTFKDFDDGSKYIKVELQIQSMAVEDTLKLKAYMLYRNIETNLDHLVEFPVFEAHRSKVWDGRDIIQRGDTSVDTYSIMVNSLIITFAGILLAIALLFANAHFNRRFFVSFLPEDFNSRRKIARKEFDIAWAHIEAGNFDAESYKELARIVRELFHLQTHGFREIAGRLGEGHPYKKTITRMLMLLANPMYRDRKLNAKEHNRVKELFDEMVPPEEFSEAELAG